MGTARPGPKPKPIAERFWSKVDKNGPNGCWLWTASHIGGGYGQFDKGRYAHRVAYELLVGPVPEGLELDHLCRVRQCVNPTHLEPVNRRTNVLRGVSRLAEQARRTQCPQGHPYDAENTYEWKGHRRCRVCNREAANRYYDARKAC